MIIKRITDFTNKEVSLTAYVHEVSGELGNAKVRPAVLVMPGGGYHACSDREAEPVALAYAAEGYHAFVLRYSVGTKPEQAFPAPLRDAEEALEMIHRHAGKWNVDSERVYAVGFSAGGHLCAALGTMGRIKPAAMILGYPCILESIGRILSNPVPGLEDKVTKETPPAFLFTTFEDELVPAENSLEFAGALNRAGIPCEFHMYQRGVHGLSLAKPHTSSGFAKYTNPRVADWFRLSIEWLRENFGDFAVDYEESGIPVLEAFEEYGIDVPLKYLWEEECCRSILLDFLPVLEDESVRKPAYGISLRVMGDYARDMITPELLMEIDEKLRKIERH